MNGYMRVAMYARVSSQRQAQDLTIKSQCAELHKRIELDKVRIDSAFEFLDDGFSGSELLRPSLERLRDQVAAGLIDKVYIHSPDRLARKFAHQAILLEEFRKYSCEVIFLNQSGLPESPETNMLLQMQGMFAEYEREKILERTRRGRRFAAARGSVSVLCRAPLGYRYFAKSADNGPACWKIDPLEAETVRLMFSLVSEHSCSLGAVCRELKHLGIQTKTGKPNWSTATVRGILVNPAYFGQARYGKERLTQRKAGHRAKRGDPVVPRQSKVSKATPIEDQIMIPVPALVSQTVFEEVRCRMDENRKRQRERKDGAKYMLSGLLICGKCGSAYCSRRQGKNNLSYYRCIGTDKYRRQGKAICDNTSINGEPLESHVWSDLCNLLNNPQRLSDELFRRQSETPVAAAQQSDAQSRVNSLQGRIDRLIDAYALGLLKENEFASRIGTLRDQQGREVAALTSLRSEALDSQLTKSAANTLAHLSSQVNDNLQTATAELKRELIQLLIKRIEIDVDTVRIVYRVPPNPFRQSPDNRGKLQHRLLCPKIPAGCLRNHLGNDVRLSGNQ